MFDTLDRFEEYLKRQEGLSPATIRQYGADCARLVHWLLKERPEVERWEQLQGADFLAYMGQHDHAPARGRRLLASWRKLWTYLQEVEGLTLSRGPREARTKKLRRLQPKYLTPAEVSRLVAAIEEPSPERTRRQKAIVTFLYGTGCRISEVLALQMDAVEYNAGGTPQKIRVIGKGGKERTVHLSPTAQRAVVDWLKLKATEGEDGPYVFSYLTGTRRGQPVSVRSVERSVKAAGARARLPAERCTPHKLRHSHATALVQAGRRLEEVQEILGHESIATTRIYVYLEPERLEAAAASLPDIV